ncbi:MAG: DUF475 domain-containing protein [Candidatus Saccharimonas sp.]
MTKDHSSLRTFLPSFVLSLAIGVWIFSIMGLSGIWLFAILVILEITFSFDNAIVNSKILSRMNNFWQQMFLTVGILFAVFIVRFALPIIIVAVSAQMSFGAVIDTAINQPAQYAEILHGAAASINAFGGTFLAMVGLGFFVDKSKKIHWLAKIEKPLARIGGNEFAKDIFMTIVVVILALTASADERTSIIVAGLFGVALHLALTLFQKHFNAKQSGKGLLTGIAAFTSFIYLNILDASFSLDGVIGAFAITQDILLIMAGLGVGALWVRSMTIHLVRAGTLAKYRYLEHGAHWAILALGIIMLVKLYHIEPAEWFTGGIGLVIILAAFYGSIIWRKSQEAA